MPEPQIVERVFAEDIVAQARRLSMPAKDVESPATWMMRVRKAALLEALKAPVDCAGCEGRPAPENNPCAVCGATLSGGKHG